MTAVLDVAYLDLPFVAHVPRRTLLLRMCADCWEDACWACRDPRCVCACENGRDTETAPAEMPCRSCGWLEDDPGHVLRCSPLAEVRIRMLAESVPVVRRLRAVA